MSVKNKKGKAIIGVILVGVSVLLILFASQIGSFINNSYRGGNVEVSVEEISDTESVETEVWEETDEETGNTVRVTRVNYIEDGVVVRSTQTGEVISESDDNVEEYSVITDEDNETIETVEDLERFTNSGRVAELGEGTIVITDENGDIVEELEASEYEDCSCDLSGE